jgi:hypothetical protein
LGDLDDSNADDSRGRAARGHARAKETHERAVAVHTQAAELYEEQADSHRERGDGDAANLADSRARGEREKAADQARAVEIGARAAAAHGC